MTTTAAVATNTVAPLELFDVDRLLDADERDIAATVREALAIARECRTLLGGSGITLEYSPLRHANNLESVLTYEGTSEMHLLSIGRALTGQSAFR